MTTDLERLYELTTDAPVFIQGTVIGSPSAVVRLTVYVGAKDKIEAGTASPLMDWSLIHPKGQHSFCLPVRKGDWIRFECTGGAGSVDVGFFAMRGENGLTPLSIDDADSPVASHVRSPAQLGAGTMDGTIAAAIA